VNGRSVRDRRLVLIRHPGRHLAAAALAGFVTPVVVGLPVLGFLVTPLVWGFFGFSAAWRTVAVLAGLLLAIGVPIMALLGRDELRTVRWIEVQPEGVTLRRIRGIDRIAVSDLRRVVIVERIKLGRSLGGEVALETVAGPVVRCPPAPAPRATAAELVAWFTAHLGPAGVDVGHETVAERAHLPIENWYTAAQVAGLWHVPVNEVAALAGRLRVRTETYSPRIGAMHGVNPERSVYEPDDVHEAAAAVAGTDPSTRD
jgi:hypothetical protein